MDFELGLKFEQFYLIALSICMFLNSKNKLFSVTVVTFLFAVVGIYFLMKIVQLGVTAWVIACLLHQLGLVLSIVSVRTTFKERFYISDFVLIVMCLVQILAFSLNYIFRTFYDSLLFQPLYALTAPILFVLTVLTLGFPPVYRILSDKFVNKDFNNGNSSSSMYIARNRSSLWNQLLGV